MWIQDWRYPCCFPLARENRNPTGPANGRNKVIEGGSFGTGKWPIRVAARMYGRPAGRSVRLGFGCASDLQEESAVSGRNLEPHRVGVIADTHGFFDTRIPELFESVDLILHAGDVGGRDILRKLSGTAPVVAVRGNVDPGTDCDDLPEAAWVSIGKVDIYMTHILTPPRPDSPPPVQARLVIFGHSHRQHLSECGGTMYFNPASAGRKRFTNPRSVGMLTVAGEDVTAAFLSLD